MKKDLASALAVQTMNRKKKKLLGSDKPESYGKVTGPEGGLTNKSSVYQKKLDKLESDQEEKPRYANGGRIPKGKY